MNQSDTSVAHHDHFLPLRRLRSGKGAAHFVSFCNMAFSAFFCIYLFLLLFLSLILKKVEKGLQKVAKAEKAMPPILLHPFAKCNTFCTTFACFRRSGNTYKRKKKVREMAFATFVNFCIPFHA